MLFLPFRDRFYMTVTVKEQPAREEGLVRWVHGHGDNSLIMASKVPDVLVLSQGHVPDDIILLGAGVHSMPLVLGEVDEVDPIPGKFEHDELNFVLCRYFLLLSTRF